MKRYAFFALVLLAVTAMAAERMVLFEEFTQTG
jgi:hypothetical protein